MILIIFALLFCTQYIPRMAGIYIHIPFCRQACSYCNFHFSTSLANKTPLLAALAEEIARRAPELQGQTIATIYFGGGTPSLLSADEINALCEIVQKNYSVAPAIELTLEANPDDLTADYLASLRDTTPVNRLSIGLQSFVANDLAFMNRAHDVAQARECLAEAHKKNFHNLSVDLIYGTPTLSDAAWRENLKIVFDYQIPHLSCYGLTVEEKTALAYKIQKKQLPPLDEEKSARHFEILLEAIAENGYEQYEISNFCRPPHYAQHNTNYWKGQNYIGIGPAAHSFDGQSRRWNIANNALYIKNLAAGEAYFETEVLSPANIFNEYMLTAFRTKWGVEKSRLAALPAAQQAHFQKEVQKHVQYKNIVENDTIFKLSDAGKLLADHIIADLFL
jgi:oxygen-independent coproporphyrinogen-3 oxidase